MVVAQVISMLRERRTTLKLSQAELAERAGVSRQTLSAIEAGRQVPSTQLALQFARVLGSTVDDLFRLSGGPVVHAVVSEPPADARVVLGRVDGRFVAHAVTGTRSADGVVVGDEHDEGSASVELFSERADIDATLLVAGCAPLIGVLADRLGRRYRDVRATWIAANSSKAIGLLERNLIHVAGVHLGSASDPDVHVRAARLALPGQRASLVNLARWKQGFVVAPGNPLHITSGADLLRPDVCCVQRAAGAGAQLLLERVCREQGHPIPRADMPLASNHAEVAALVRWGVVDVGVAIESVALDAGLDFIPLSEERFDLVVPDSRLDTPAFARFLDLIDARAFRSEAAGMPGYDLSLAGHVSTVTAS